MGRQQQRSWLKAWIPAVALGLAFILVACILAVGGWSTLQAATGDEPPGNAASASPFDDAPAAPVASAHTSDQADSKATSSDSKKAAPPSDRDRRIRLNFKSAPWAKVLKRVAKHAGLTLVMKKSPSGTFTRSDLNQYTIAEAIWVLNRELEPAGYRLMRQGSFLLLLDLDALRSDYRPALTRR